MDVEFDGGSDLRVFENKKKMIYEIVSVSASAKAKIAHWAEWILWWQLKRRWRVLWEFAQGTCHSPRKGAGTAAGSPSNVSMKHQVADAVLWLPQLTFQHEKRFKHFVKCFPLLKEKLIGAWHRYSSRSHFGWEALLKLRMNVSRIEGSLFSKRIHLNIL